MNRFKNGLQFSSVSRNLPDAVDLVKLGSDLVKLELNADKQRTGSFLINTYSVPLKKEHDTNEKFVKTLYKYCAKKSGLNTDADFNDTSVLAQAMSNPQFAWTYMAVVIDVLSTVNAVTEVQDIMRGANVVEVGLGDSETFITESPALYKIQRQSYGAQYSRPQRMLKTPINILPEAYTASVDFDVINMTPLGFDFGKEIAKLAKSFRVRMYVDVVNTLFAVANVSSTPYYGATFSRKGYLTIATRLQGICNSNVTAYGTLLAFSEMSNGVTTGFSTLDEMNKNGYISTLYGVPSMMLTQTVDTNSASHTFRVPNDRVLLLSNTSDKPVKVVKEKYYQIVERTGTTSTLNVKNYTIIDSWKAQLATAYPYGIQLV